jgi:hypothetical protein
MTSQTSIVVDSEKTPRGAFVGRMQLCEHGRLSERKLRRKLVAFQSRAELSDGDVMLSSHHQNSAVRD